MLCIIKLEGEVQKMKKSLRALILTLGILATTGIGSTVYAQDCSTVKQVNSVESIQAICAKYGIAVPKGAAVKAQVAAPCKVAPTKTAPVKAATTKATPAKAVPTKTTPAKTTATKATPTPVASTSTANNKLEKEVVTLVNQERAKQGLAPLTDNVKLSNVARTKSEDMVAKNYFDHTSPTYGSPFDMMKQFGITYKAAGENIAMGQQTASSVMTSWMNSPGHKANILSKNFTDIGVGVAKDKSGAIYWTQEFIGK
ncbi:serine protease [Clostridium estertheticum]|nr:serine protease [Clostridium estertheticum]MBX4270345.1 serine protease [Clostridium estertheticum]WLC80884.1 serine protease [Clostridium estertheticum]WLC87934.1 serine protease [Clostridium estertheticum]